MADVCWWPELRDGMPVYFGGGVRDWDEWGGVERFELDPAIPPDGGDRGVIEANHHGWLCVVWEDGDTDPLTEAGVCTDFEYFVVPAVGPNDG